MPDIDEIVASALKIPRTEVSDTLEYGRIPQWDSLSHVNLMLKLEDLYGVEIDEDRMIELTSVRAIKDFIASEA